MQYYKPLGVDYRGVYKFLNETLTPSLHFPLCGIGCQAFNHNSSNLHPVENLFILSPRKHRHSIIPTQTRPL